MSNEIDRRTDEPQGLTVRIARTFLSGPHSMLFLVAAAVVGVVADQCVAAAAMDGANGGAPAANCCCSCGGGTFGPLTMPGLGGGVERGGVTPPAMSR